jgi:hypothetical protein
MTPTTAGYAETLLRHVLTNLSSLTDNQLGDAGAAARNLLSFAWQREERNSWLVTNALRSVCATIGSDVNKTRELLRKAIDPEHLSKHGYEEAPCIATFASEIASSDPELAADIYASIFSHEEQSNSKTDMISSRILPITSTRHQDYNHAKWELAQKYPQLIVASLASAARTMVRVAEACAYRERESVCSDRPIVSFAVGEKEAGIIEDYSYLWDHGSNVGKQDEMRIVDSFFEALRDRAQQPESLEEVATVLEFLITGKRAAIVWRRLLELGAEPTESDTPSRGPPGDCAGNCGSQSNSCNRRRTACGISRYCALMQMGWWAAERKVCLLPLSVPSANDGPKVPKDHSVLVNSLR